LKIIIVHNANQQFAGDDVVVAQESKLLADAGNSVVPFRRSNWDVESYAGIRKISLAKRTIWASDTKRDFERLLAKEQPDLVHVHNTFVMISPSIFSACVEAHVPVVQTLHSYRLLCPAATLFRNGKVCEECMHHSLLRSVRYGCYKNSRATTGVTALMLAFHRLRETWRREISCFVTLTEFCRNKFIEGGLPVEKVLVKPNFVDPDPGHRMGDGEYAIFLGRLSPEKCVNTILAAWKRLRVPIPLLIAGTGPEEQQLRARAARDGLTHVHFAGQLPRDQAVAALNNARFLVFPSEWYEGFPMTLAESFACSTPVICSRMGAMQEIVTDGRTGLHVTPGDVDEWARKVEWAWTHPKEVRIMGKEARNDYESKYTATKNYLMLMEIYKRAIAGEFSLA
jgi:glycosyltransferase involved in cell wall biosynthesis